MARFSDPEPLHSDHILGGFDCGVSSLNLWLERHARAAQGAGSARSYVVTDADQGGRVVGYHAIVAASIEHREATERTRRGMPPHPIPAVLLARLAVDKSVQNKGLGAFLLRDAMLRAVTASEDLGVRLLLVHAMNERARAFYLRFGFEESTTDELNLQMIIKDIKAVIS